MTECINVYRATQPIAPSLLSCGVRLSVRLFVTLMYRNGQTYYQTFSSPGDNFSDIHGELYSLPLFLTKHSP